jgi:hypothetical protein
MGFVGFFSIRGIGSAALDYARIRIGVVGPKVIMLAPDSDRLE